MLRTLIKLLVLAAIVVGIFHYGLPALRRRGSVERNSAELETGPVECVDAAEAGSNAVGEIATRVAPGDRGAWLTAEAEARVVLVAAREACRCEGTACRRAEQALDELDGVLTAYRGLFAERGARFVNPASSHERAQNLLAEARALME